MTDWPRLIRAVAPKARADLIAAFTAADDRIAGAEIVTPLRIAHFLAQIAVETGGFRGIEEDLSYTAERLHAVWPRRFPTVASAKPYARNPKALAEKVYGGRMGNVNAGDGYRYRGGGMLQTTGRANYRAAGFEANPDRLRTPAGAIAAALTFWSDHGCNAIADRDDVVALRERINGGHNGLDEARAYLATAKAAVKTIPAQARLKALRYPVGAIDGDHGTRTTGAVAAFQANQGLPLTGALDDATVAALDTAEAIDPAAKDANLAKSRTVQGSTVAGTFGLTEAAQSAVQLKDQLTDAQSHFSAGTLVELVIGLLIAAGAAYAIYARWDDAGRPVPRFLNTRFPALAGKLAGATA